MTCTSSTGSAYCGSRRRRLRHALHCARLRGRRRRATRGRLRKAGCVPLTCNGAGSTRFCGAIGDGCGGTLDCGDLRRTDRHVRRRRRRRRLHAIRPARTTTCTPDGGGQYCGTHRRRLRRRARLRRPAPNGMACDDRRARPASARRARHGDAPGSVHIATCTGDDEDDRQRHGLRPGRQDAALQRRRVRPERARSTRSRGASPAIAAAPRCRASRSRGAAATPTATSRSTERARRHQHPAGHAGGQVAAAGDDPEASPPARTTRSPTPT